MTFLNRAALIALLAGSPALATAQDATSDTAPVPAPTEAADPAAAPEAPAPANTAAREPPSLS